MSKDLNWVYYLSVISVNQCTINNDFDGIRINSDGIIFTTDVSRKYLMKKCMQNNGIKIAGLSSKCDDGTETYLKNDDLLIKALEDLAPKSDKKTKKDDDKKDSHVSKQLKYLNKEYKDLSMFGYMFTDTFKGKIDSLSNSTITGFLQVSNGINIGDNNNIINMTIVNGAKGDEGGGKSSSSIGSKQIIEEAYILNVITINPNQYKENFELYFDKKESITQAFENDLKLIENTLKCDANSFRTASRNNIFNEKLIKIESATALNLGKNPIIFKDGEFKLSTIIEKYKPITLI